MPRPDAIPEFASGFEEFNALKKAFDKLVSLFYPTALVRPLYSANVTQAYQGAAFGLHHHLLELIEAGQAGIRRHIGDSVETLRLAGRRLEVVALDCSRQILGCGHRVCFDQKFRRRGQ